MFGGWGLVFFFLRGAGKRVRWRVDVGGDERAVVVVAIAQGKKSVSHRHVPVPIGVGEELVIEQLRGPALDEALLGRELRVR